MKKDTGDMKSRIQRVGTSFTEMKKRVKMPRITRIVTCNDELYKTYNEEDS